jgi:hypothetical protein
MVVCRQRRRRHTLVYLAGIAQMVSAKRRFAFLQLRRHALRSYTVAVRLARQQRQGVIVRLHVAGVSLGMPL